MSFEEYTSMRAHILGFVLRLSPPPPLSPLVSFATIELASQEEEIISTESHTCISHLLLSRIHAGANAF